VQQRAFALFQDLNENLLNIDDLYKGQMELHEQDFLAAYRGQMNHVRKEVEALRA
jgi:hypothetical protein